MKHFKQSPCLFWLALVMPMVALMSGCGKERTKKVTIDSLRYARGFSVVDSASAKWVEVTQPYPGAAAGPRYVLVPHGQTVPAHDADVQVIFVPVSSMVCTSTTHIPLLDYLASSDKLIGFPTTDYISSTKMRTLVDAGKVKDLGTDKGMNLEALVTLHPDVVMGYTLTADLGQLKKIKSMGIPVVINAEYLEKHPLGRAEWIKFMALFVGKEKMADSVFRQIEKEYVTTQAKVAQVSTRPTVMSGVVYGDAWFMPGGNNYAARLLKDAGCDYLWKETSSNGFLEISFESVFDRARDADFWIGAADFHSLQELAGADRRYGLFKPFREKKIFTYNARRGAKGGNEFLELGYLRPDLILKDLVKIVHPDVMPGYTLFFYEQLP